MADFTIINASGASISYSDSGSSFVPTTLASGNGFLQLAADLWVEIQPDGTQLYYAEIPPLDSSSSSSSQSSSGSSSSSSLSSSSNSSSSGGPGSILYLPCSPGSSGSSGSSSSSISSSSSSSSSSQSSSSSSSSAGSLPPPECLSVVLGKVGDLLPKSYLVPYLGAPIDLQGNEVHAGQPNLWTAQTEQPGTSVYAHDGFHTAIDRAVELTQRLAHGFNLLDRNSGNNCSRPQAKCQVNPTSGNLLVSFKLPSSGPIDPPIELFYNSQALLQPSGITYFGVGWSGLFSQQVTSDSAQRFLFLIQRATNIGTTLGSAYSWLVYRANSASPVAFVQERITGRLTQFQYDSGLISQIQDTGRAHYNIYGQRRQLN